MLMEVKNQLKVSLLSLKYALQREMLNKITFISNILFMILNNASFIVQWIVIYSIRNDVGGYSFKQIILLWGFAALSYGISRFFFREAFELSDIIIKGSLDNYLVQPKNILISSITSGVEVSAIGDIIYGYIMLFIYGITIKNFLLFTFCGICGGFIMTSIAIIFSSLSFWFGRIEMIITTANNAMVFFDTYPEGIFKGFIKILFYTIIPIGLTAFLPVRLLTSFNWNYIGLILLGTIILISLAFIIFYSGLKKYSSTNLMNARV